FGLTVEVPDRLARLLRPSGANEAAPTDRLVVQPPPPVSIDRHERERAAMRKLATDQAAEAARSESEADAADEVAGHPWYHTIQFPDGSATPGRFDHRELLPHYGLPENLRGKRALDVGSGDGFWAFELERRGAEVTSLDIESFIDVDLPPALHDIFVNRPVDLSFRRGLEIAHRRLGSRVKLINQPVYDLDPDEVGTFDFVHAGDILLHLRDPILALQRLRTVTSGECLFADYFDPALDELGAGTRLTRYRGGWDDVTWWAPSLSTLTQMVADAGYEDVQVVTTYCLSDSDQNEGRWRAVIRART
ncbi:MAG: tRNA (mo5U34)-methyltransferase, partial [Actinomycetota bacterium]|nr:tRNA (mo5U34)-methyltransferase [Actinomycetota bacterium]